MDAITRTGENNMAVTTQIQHLSFTVNDTNFDAKVTKYNLNGDIPYIVAIRLNQNGENTITHITKHKTKFGALKAYNKALVSMGMTHYNVVISELQRIDSVNSAKLTMSKEPSLDGFEGNLKDNLEVCQEIIDSQSSYARLKRGELS